MDRYLNIAARAFAVLLLACAGVALLLLVLSAPIPQDPAYHLFVDERHMLGVPNFWNVMSNLPFLLVGIVGLWALRNRAMTGCVPELRLPYAIFFVGVGFVALGSGYYHLAPGNDTLVWDRLPMTIAFMSFFAAMLGEAFTPKLGLRLLAPLLILGVFSVFYWDYTESLGRGDLRPYAVVQFLPMFLIPAVLLRYPSGFSGQGYLWWVLVFYGASKVAEWADAPVYEALGVMSGHSIKHLLAAIGTFFFYLALRNRRPTCD